MATIKIKTDGIKGEVYINGKKVPDVLSYTISHEAMSLPVLQLDILASDITFEGDGFLPELPEIFKEFYVRRDVENE